MPRRLDSGLPELRRWSLEEIPNRLQDRPKVARLGHEILRLRLVGPDGEALLYVPTIEDDGDMSQGRIPFDHGCHAESVELGHDYVEDDQVRPLCLDSLETLLPIGGRQNPVSLVAEQIRQAFPPGPIV